jgi:hypothetical protein
MKAFIRKYTTQRAGYSGWALAHPDNQHPLSWTTCTTKKEVLELRREFNDGVFRKRGYVPVRVSIGVSLAYGEKQRLYAVRELQSGAQSGDN